MFNNGFCPYDLCACSPRNGPHTGCVHPSTGLWRIKPDTSYYCCRLCFFFHQRWDTWLQMAIACSIGLPKIQFPSSQCLRSPVWNSSTANLENASSIFPANSDSASVQHSGVSGYLAGVEPSHMSCLEGLCCAAACGGAIWLNWIHSKKPF